MLITLDKFLDKYLGTSKGYPTDNEFKGECLSIVKLYIKECFGINPPASGSGSAYGYWSNFPTPLDTIFEKIENSAELVPEKGWIAIWKPWSTNQYGHISIVADSSTTGTLKNWAQNWTSRIFQLESNRYTNVVGFLKPRVIISDDTMTEEQKRILDFIGTRTEGDVRQAFGALADFPNLVKEIEALKKLSQDLADRVAVLESENKANNELIIDWQSKTSTANSKISKLEAEVKTQADEKNTWKNRYEQALKDQVNKYTGWQLIRLGVNKLLVQKSK